METVKKSNKIMDVVRVLQFVKKWKKLAKINPNSGINNNGGSNKKGLKFLKKTLSFNDRFHVVPKGFLAVCVGSELKRFVIPTQYLRHEAFGILLREAEEEFGFHQQGVLKFPCKVDVFENVLKVIKDKRSTPMFFNDQLEGGGFSGSSSTHHQPLMCRSQ
ncbi:hypothetical protein ACFE04_013663 [Oxalis oulophora]